MADTPANLAIDKKCSTQVHIQGQASQLPGWHTVPQRLNTDFMGQPTGCDASWHPRDIGNGTVKRQHGPGRQQQWTT
ncbi:unnamed protein product [Phytophthora lilii]|uniref:Unnamed protein product n=1 Tax=Phytophthora lilii TaxID=2077276 RepID=A0A9W6TC24_9STRA|nr:unnamed protein product [Phytophthora lilii]